MSQYEFQFHFPGQRHGKPERHLICTIANLGQCVYVCNLGWWGRMLGYHSHRHGMCMCIKHKYWQVRKAICQSIQRGEGPGWESPAAKLSKTNSPPRKCAAACCTMHCVTGRMWVGLRIENALSTPLFKPWRPWGWSMKQEQRFLPSPSPHCSREAYNEGRGWVFGWVDRNLLQPHTHTHTENRLEGVRTSGLCSVACGSGDERTGDENWYATMRAKVSYESVCSVWQVQHRHLSRESFQTHTNRTHPSGYRDLPFLHLNYIHRATTIIACTVERAGAILLGEIVTDPI